MLSKGREKKRPNTIWEHWSNWTLLYWTGELRNEYNISEYRAILCQRQRWAMEMKLQMLTLNFLVTLSTCLFLARVCTCQTAWVGAVSFVCWRELGPFIVCPSGFKLNLCLVLFCFTLLKTLCFDGDNDHTLDLRLASTLPSPCLSLLGARMTVTSQGLKVLCWNVHLMASQCNMGDYI